MQNEKKELIIEGIRDLQELITSLINSGYEIKITPIYEKQTERDRRYRIRPRISHYAVVVGEKLGKGDEEQCLDD